MSNYTSPLYYNQALIILDTTPVTSQTQGSMVLYGGLNVNSTRESTNQSTGSVVFYGGVGVQGTIQGGFANFKNNVTIQSTTESVDIDSGALVIEGGVGIQKNLHVGGDTTITGNLTVNGTTLVLEKVIDVVGELRATKLLEAVQEEAEFQFC